jgi:iron complex outermembrane receptor protein
MTLTLALASRSRAAPHRDRSCGCSRVATRRGRNRAVRASMHALCCAVVPVAALAQTDTGRASGATELAPVVVTATRTAARAFDIPASIDRIGGDEVRDGRAQINLSESLGGVPGLLARDRQNYAQDVQISVRGFGARASFGIRGVRLYVDGIPATLPDGQGQISNVDLGSVGSIEVLRGPYSALYGNSSGGVIQVFTEEGTGAPRLGFSVAGGSDGVLRLGAKAIGAVGGFGYVVSASRFSTDGYRDHSAATRNLGNAKLTLHPDADSQLTLVANSVALPRAQDPLGLTRAQFEANPRGVDPTALAFDTRKTVDQTQAGLIYERRLDPANAIRLLTYAGHRNAEQFQAIPTAPQASPLHPGGVIALGRDYRGVDLRWTLKATLLDAPFTLVSGLAYDALAEHRQGYRNFIGTTLGVQGALRRDETNDVSNSDQYLQAAWQLTPRWSLNAGLRHSAVRFKSTDAYIVGTNPDDSGSATYDATLPVLGVLYAVNDDVHVYATAGRGFETPTLNELAYRPGGATGLNFGLQAARSTSVEAGVKTRLAALGELNVAVFQADTDHEIVTQTNLGGRATFQNAGATRRTGVELGWSKQFLEHLRAQLALTALDATYRDAFKTCTATPCSAPNLLVPAGNRIPGVARGSLYAALNWAPPTGWRGGVEARYLSGVVVNDINSDAAPAYAVAAANLGYGVNVGPWALNGFVRVDNLFARRYAGSVIVNEGNSRYFEPAPGRTWLTSVSATLKF